MKEKLNPNNKKLEEVATVMRSSGDISEISHLIRDVEGAGTVALDILNKKRGSNGQDVVSQIQQYEVVREMNKKGSW